MIKFTALCNAAGRRTKARKPALITTIHYQTILDRASTSCHLRQALTLHQAMSSATPNASPALVRKPSRGRSLMSPRHVARSTLPSYSSSTAPCLAPSPLAAGSRTLPRCLETHSRNPWCLFSRYKEEVLQKLTLRTSKHSASETWSQEHLVFQHDKAICRLGRAGAFSVLKGSQLLCPARFLF